MAGVMKALLDTEGRRPGSVTAAVALSLISGCGTFAGGMNFVAALVVTGTEYATDWFVNTTFAVGAVQVVTAVLLVVGGVRLALGLGRRLLVTGMVLQLLTCVPWTLYAVVEVAGNPQDGWDIAGYFLTVAGFFAVMATISLLQALSATATRFLSLGGYHRAQPVASEALR